MIRPRFRFINVVWGEAFTDAFLRVCLPSHLSPSNLPVWAPRTDSEYWIYTTPQWAEAMRQSDSYKQLASLMPIRHFIIGGLNRIGKYEVMNQCHAHFIRSAADETCSLIFQSPDIVWSDGSFARLLEVFNSGMRNVAIGSLRLTKETFLPALVERYGRAGVFESISARDLAALSLDHLHPVTRAQLWGVPNDSKVVQGEMFWPVNREGLIIRRFRFQPLLVTPQNRGYVPKITTDADYTDAICDDIRDWYVVRDSDDICYVDFTPEDYGRKYGGNPIQPGAPTVEEEADWARINAFPMHRKFARTAIRFHCTDCSDAWKDVEARAESVMMAILARLDEPATTVEKRLSASRYVSPTFLARKLRQKGLGGVLGEAWSRFRAASLRRMFGPEITINAAR